jgi:hypothetical protein
MSGKPYITDSAFDPTRLLDTNTLGVAPANTTLTVLFYQNDSDSVNVARGNLTTVSISSFTFPNEASSTRASQVTVRSSLEVSNDEPIVGNTALPTSEEIRYRTYAAKAAQQRSVTRNDYEAYMYMMPPQFGSVKRASIINDPSSSNRRLSVYIISEDANGNLTQPSSTLKENVKIWLNKNKMLNDILNETAGDIAAGATSRIGSDASEYPTMGGKTYTSQDMNTLAAPQQMQVSDDTPDFLKKAMSGHSAKVVKAIETKHGTRAS